jgi:hypothetical protein
MMASTKKTKPVEQIKDLEPMLTRLKLTAIRDQLDTLLDQAARAELNLREGLPVMRLLTGGISPPVAGSAGIA